MSSIEFKDIPHVDTSAEEKELERARIHYEKLTSIYSLTYSTPYSPSTHSLLTLFTQIKEAHVAMREANNALSVARTADHNTRLAIYDKNVAGVKKAILYHLPRDLVMLVTTCL
jgi:hypothetical protein